MKLERVIAIDPGALRLGMAYVEKTKDDYRLWWSGVYGIERGPDEEYQDYRRRLIQYWSWQMHTLLVPDTVVVNERLPAVHSRAVFSTQPLLAQIALGCIHMSLYQHKVEWHEVAASSVKKSVTGHKDASKVKVRNGVIEVFPDLAAFKKSPDWPFDRWDAIAIALHAVGYKV